MYARLARTVQRLTRGQVWLLTLALLAGYLPASRATLGLEARIAERKRDIDRIIDSAHDLCARRSCDPDTDGSLRELNRKLLDGTLSANDLYALQDRRERLSKFYMYLFAPALIFVLNWLWYGHRSEDRPAAS